MLRAACCGFPLINSTNVPFPAWPYRYFGFSGAGKSEGAAAWEPLARGKKRGEGDDGPHEGGFWPFWIEQVPTSGTERKKKVPVVLAAKSFLGEGTKHRREQEDEKKNCYCYVFFLSALDFNWPSPLLSYKPPTFLLCFIPLLYSAFSSSARDWKIHQKRGKQGKRREKRLLTDSLPFYLQRVVRFFLFFLPSFILDSICHPSVHRDSDPRQRLIFA